MPNLENICLHKSATAKPYPVTETDKDLLKKVREDETFVDETIVDETFIRDSTIWCKSIVGIDASQLHPVSKRQAMPTGLYTRWELDSKSGNFKPRQNKMTVLKK